MSSSNFEPNRFVIEESVADSPMVQQLLSRVSGAEIQFVSEVNSTSQMSAGTLEVVRFKGRFIKPCPGTSHYLCCGYQILHLGTNCSLGCTYCILQSYFPGAALRIFANMTDMWQQLEAHLRNSNRKVHRIGTGEFTDSLLLDPLTRMSEELVPFFADQDNAVLELKTKTTNVDLLGGLEHGGHTIVAWSLNTPYLIERQECGAASLSQRLAAAARCQAWGYRLAFHFDPLIAYPGWQQDYADLVAQLFKAVDPAGIAWISLGTLRFMPSLKATLFERIADSAILGEEFITGMDGKLRYFRDLRVEMYRHLSDLLRQGRRDLCIYLCMESDDIWREGLGFSAADRGGLVALLDQQALP
ncbi:MAG: DNA photolyase [Deltaproteobacteria bacterium]|nr:DNA photolyase [Deltaproteobacteria bacterium]MBW2071160.1 DNA photolyase [Deltaproteobacteria bacterium]